MLIRTVLSAARSSTHPGKCLPTCLIVGPVRKGDDGEGRSMIMGVCG